MEQIASLTALVHLPCRRRSPLYPDEILSRTTRYAVLILSTAAACTAACMLVVAIVRLRFPYGIDYEEGNILNTAVRMTHWLSPYPDPHGWPRILNPYGPVAYTISAACVKLFGLSLFASRIVVMLSAAAVALLIGILLKRTTGIALLGFGFGMFYLADPVVNFWMPALRVDFIGIALVFAGLLAMREKRPSWAAILFLLAIFTKHTLLAAPAACVFWALQERDWQAARRLVTVCALVGGVAFVALEVATHGWFAFYLFKTHPDPFRWAASVGWIGLLLQTNPLLLILTLALIARDVWNRKASLAGLYVLFALGMAFITAGKLGSNSNHLLEPTAALLLASGEGLWVMIILPERARILAPLSAVLLACLVTDNLRRVEWPERDSGCEQAILYLRAAPGDKVMSENLAGAVLAEKTLVVSNPFVYTQLVKHAGWSDIQLVNDLRSRSIGIIMLPAFHRQEWSDNVMEAIRENYREMPGCECQYSASIFRPR